MPSGTKPLPEPMLTHNNVATDLGQHQIRQRLIARWHHAITWSIWKLTNYLLIVHKSCILPCVFQAESSEGSALGCFQACSNDTTLGAVFSEMSWPVGVLRVPAVSTIVTVIRIKTYITQCGVVEPYGIIELKSSLVQAMTWHWTSNKPLSEPMMTFCYIPWSIAVSSCVAWGTVAYS